MNRYSDLSEEEIFRLIKNGDCAVFEFQDWLVEYIWDKCAVRTDFED